ncbi:TonB-dependent receptor [Planctomicrobium piriforme]|uniref:EndoU nuclease n=1 Tax=Planctomicrobium piriforme TaxID=1576369 RepID=A0A1I3QHM2_9PLAN|nr:hypothetical protein [Planctomicrobium piriforme]SFJ33528.1 hypothetical protein SAMN05421753_11898 [Planctomicrobium piriforme]
MLPVSAYERDGYNNTSDSLAINGGYDLTWINGELQTSQSRYLRAETTSAGSTSDDNYNSDNEAENFANDTDFISGGDFSDDASSFLGDLSTTLVGYDAPGQFLHGVGDSNDAPTQTKFDSWTNELNGEYSEYSEWSDGHWVQDTWADDTKANHIDHQEGQLATGASDGGNLNKVNQAVANAGPPAQPTQTPAGDKIDDKKEDTDPGAGDGKTPEMDQSDEAKDHVEQRVPGADVSTPQQVEDDAKAKTQAVENKLSDESIKYYRERNASLTLAILDQQKKLDRITDPVKRAAIQGIIDDFRRQLRENYDALKEYCKTGSAANGVDPVAQLKFDSKLLRVLQKAIDSPKLSAEVKSKLKELTEPTALLKMAGFMTAYAAAHASPLAPGLVVVDAYFTISGGIDIGLALQKIYLEVNSAVDEDSLDQAANVFIEEASGPLADGILSIALLAAGKGAAKFHENYQITWDTKSRSVTLSSGGLGELDRLKIVKRDNPGKLTFDPATNSWKSPGGLIYGPDKKYGNRVEHVLNHLSDPSKSLFNVDRTKLVGLLDEAWAKKGTPLPKDPGVYIIDMGRVVGTKGETRIRLVVIPGTSEVITAYPIH